MCIRDRSGSNGNELFNISQRLISPCIDRDKDGACEFFTYDGNNVYMRNANGNIAWSYALGNYKGVGVTKGSLVIFGNTFDYYNKTGTLKVVKVDNDGNEIWSLTKSYTSGDSGWLHPVGDLNGDGIADYAFSPWGVGYALAISGASGNVFWELDNVSIEFIGDFDGDGKGDLFNITHIEYVFPYYWENYWKGGKSGEGLTGDNLAYIFNVSTSDYFAYVISYGYSTSNEYMGFDFNGDGYKDMVFVVNPEKQNSTIYMVTLKQPPIPKPDLTPEIVINPTVVANQPVEIKINVTNIGTASSTATTLDLYIDDKKVEPLNVPALSAGETTTLSYSYTFAEGSHQIRAVVDPDNEVEELNELNNEDSVEINAVALKPDLIIEYIKAPQYIKKFKDGNVSVEAEFAIKNIGFAAVTDPFVIRAWLADKSADLTVSDTLDPGQSIVFRVNVTVVPGYEGKYVTSIGHNYTAIVGGNVSLGVKTVKAMVDADNEIAELNETNNNATATSEVTRPDLISMLSLPPFEEVPPGSYNVTVRVKNTGHVFAEPTLLMVKFENIVSGSVTYQNFTVPKLEPGESWQDEFTHEFDEGIYNITAYANVNHLTQQDPWDAEVDYENNAMTKQFIVHKPSPVNVTLPNFYNVMKGETRKFTLVLNSSKFIGEFDLFLYFDRRIVIVDNFNPLLPNVTGNIKNYWKYNKGYVEIIGKDLNNSGDVAVANITLRCVDDKGRTSILDLKGKVRDVNGFPLSLNVKTGNFSSLKITDLRPFIYVYPSLIADENNTVKVVVRNMRHTP